MVRFDLFCLGSFLVQSVMIVPNMFIPSFALGRGVSNMQAATIVSVLGISNTVGRFTAGLLTFLGLGSIRVYNTGICLAGVTCFLLPWLHTFPLLVLFAVCYGLFIGVAPPLQTVILVEQLGLDLLPSSFGLVCFVRGLGSVFGPTMAGVLYSLCDSLSAPFHFTGCLLVVATLLHAVMVRCPRSLSGD